MDCQNIKLCYVPLLQKFIFQPIHLSIYLVNLPIGCMYIDLLEKKADKLPWLLRRVSAYNLAMIKFMILRVRCC